MSMSEAYHQMVEIGDRLVDLWSRQAEWSQATFGLDSDRGPIGPLKHLAREAVEAQDAPGDIEEYADCVLLILDASRRAGFGLSQLIDAATAKHEKNRARSWPVSTSDEPVEHVREEGAIR